jgi:ABC-2 type transport system permease protein
VSVWAFVRLKLRLTANSLRAGRGRKALFLLGLAMGGLLAIGGYSTFATPGLAGDTHGAANLLPLGGATLVLGWLLLPLIFFGVDESLDPARFALLPLRPRTLITGQLAAALVGIPALATLAATAGTVETAARLGGPGAAAVQVAGISCGLVLCVALCRAVTSAFAGALRSRRSRDLAAVLLALLAAMIGPLRLAALAGAQSADQHAVTIVARVVAWTPLGAPYSVGLDVASRPWAVPVKLLIVVLAIAGLLRLWSATVESAMVGTVAGSARRANATAGPVALLLPRRFPRTRFGALVAREVRYWTRETRRRATLITFAAAGIFLPISLAAAGGPPGGMVLFVGSFAAVGLANQFGYDGSALAANVTAAVPARQEIESRTVAHAIFTLPFLLVVSVVVGVASGDPAGIPADLGLLIAAYGVGLAVVLPISVRTAFALPDTANPFATSSGGSTAKSLLTIAVLVGTLVLSLPLQLAALALDPVWPWIGLPAGIAYGVAAYLMGATYATALLDRRLPEVLAAVSPSR